MLRHLRIPVYHVLQPRSEKARSNRLSFCKALGHLLIIFSHCRVGTQWWFLCCYLQLHSRNFTIFKLVFFLLNERTRVLDSFLSNETIFLWVSSYVFRWVSFVLMFLTVLLSCEWLFYDLFSMALLSCSPFQVSNVPICLISPHWERVWMSLSILSKDVATHRRRRPSMVARQGKEMNLCCRDIS